MAHVNEIMGKLRSVAAMEACLFVISREDCMLFVVEVSYGVVIFLVLMVLLFMKA